MRKKTTKKNMDQELLEALFQAEKEWKKLQFILKQSVSPSESGSIHEAVARSKYLFLLREARHRQVHALQYKSSH